MRDQTAFISPIATRRVISDAGGRMGNLDRLHRGPVADHADQRGGDAGSWFSQALAVRARYKGQSALAGAGAAGAVGLFVAWIVNSGIGG